MSGLDDLVKDEMANAKTATPRAARPRPEKLDRLRKPPAEPAAPAWESLADKRAHGAVDDTALDAAVTGTSDLRKQVKSALQEERARVAERAKELATVETELAKLAVKESQDVATLRGRLEELDRTLYRAERDLKAKAEAHRVAEERAEALRAEKKALREHLAMMVLGSEARKEEKLRELLDVAHRRPER